MRYLLTIASLMIAGALSAAVESFTLDDGRTFVGEYDEDAQRLYTSVDGKPVSMLVAKDSITERVPYRQAKAKAPAQAEPLPLTPAAADDAATPAPAAAAPAPKPMTKEELAAAEAAYARGLKVKAADELEAEAKKARRQATEARSDSERKVKEAKRHWAAFRKRALSEDVLVSGEPSPEVVILPKSGGNSSATAEALAEAERLAARARELDGLARSKEAEALTVRP